MYTVVKNIYRGKNIYPGFKYKYMYSVGGCLMPVISQVFLGSL